MIGVFDRPSQSQQSFERVPDGFAVSLPFIIAEFAVGFQARVLFHALRPRFAVIPAVFELALGPGVVIVLRKGLHQIRQVLVQVDP